MFLLCKFGFSWNRTHEPFTLSSFVSSDTMHGLLLTSTKDVTYSNGKPDGPVIYQPRANVQWETLELYLVSNHVSFYFLYCDQLLTSIHHVSSSFSLLLTLLRQRIYSVAPRFLFT